MTAKADNMDQLQDLIREALEAADWDEEDTDEGVGLLERGWHTDWVRTYRASADLTVELPPADRAELVDTGLTFKIQHEDCDCEVSVSASVYDEDDEAIVLSIHAEAEGSRSLDDYEMEQEAREARAEREEDR